MGVLKGDGSNDRVKLATVSLSVANLPTDAYTLAWLTKRGSVGTFDALGYLLSGTGNGTAELGLSFDSTASNLLIDNGSAAKTNTSFTSTANPYLLVLSKATGTATPRLGWKLSSSGVWTHEDLNNPDSNQTAATMLEFFAWQNNDFFDGWIGLFGAWAGAMSDANKEKLDDNWRTSDWYNTDAVGHHGSKPVCLIQFNVAVASLVDLMGNVTGLVAESGSNYPTLDAAETLNGWNFDGTGASGSLSAAPTDTLTTTEAVTMNLKLMPRTFN